MDTATSKSTINIVIVFLGVFALAALAAVFFLVDGGTAADKVAIIVGPMGVALGAIAGVLSNTRAPVPAAPPVVMDPPVVAPQVIDAAAPHGPLAT